MTTHPVKREIPSRASKIKKIAQRQLHVSQMAPKAGSPKEKKLNDEYTITITVTHRQYHQRPLVSNPPGFLMPP